MVGYDDNYNEVDDVKEGKSANKIQGLKTPSPKGVASNASENPLIAFDAVNIFLC